MNFHLFTVRFFSEWALCIHLLYAAYQCCSAIPYARSLLAAFLLTAAGPVVDADGVSLCCSTVSNGLVGWCLRGLVMRAMRIYSGQPGVQYIVVCSCSWNNSSFSCLFFSGKCVFNTICVFWNVVYSDIFSVRHHYTYILFCLCMLPQCLSKAFLIFL